MKRFVIALLCMCVVSFHSDAYAGRTPDRHPSEDFRLPLSDTLAPKLILPRLEMPPLIPTNCPLPFFMKLGPKKPPPRAYVDMPKGAATAVLREVRLRLTLKSYPGEAELVDVAFLNGLREDHWPRLIFQ